MTTARADLSSRNWFGKASAGLILGFGLALALSGLFAWFGPEGLQGGSGKTQFTMWIVAPLWAAVLCTCFLFRDGWRAWLSLGGANLLCFGLLYGGRWLLA